MNDDIQMDEDEEECSKCNNSYYDDDQKCDHCGDKYVECTKCEPYWYKTNISYFYDFCLGKLCKYKVEKYRFICITCTDEFNRDDYTQVERK
jgi:hypothetical protein